MKTDLLSRGIIGPAVASSFFNFERSQSIYRWQAACIMINCKEYVRLRMGTAENRSCPF